MTMAPTGAVTGAPRVWLRLEGIAVASLAALLYARGGHSWLLFAATFLVPDVSLVAFAAGPRMGAWAYNAAHSYVGPAFAAAAAILTGRPPIAALVWAAHIGFDRALGYGLKYATRFGDTHLGELRGDRARAIAAAS